jgi:hypothetical protein
MWIVLLSLALASPCSSPCGCAEDEKVLRCEAERTLKALRAKDAAALLALVGKEGVACGDALLERDFIGRSLSAPGSQLHAWLFDERVFQEKHGGTARHSLAFTLSKDRVRRVDVEPLGDHTWNVIFAHTDGFQSVVFRWRGGRWFVAAAGLFCM